jgi:DNA repair protein RecO (recombination protein O)
MIIKTKGIIFRSVKYRETSLILEIYTREYGLRSYIINGVRKAKATTSAALLQVMSLLDIVAYEQESRDINRIKEVKPFYLYQNLLFDIRRSSVGMFMLEIARKSIREKEPNPSLFDFLEESFRLLDETKESIVSFHISFLIHLSVRLGLQPEFNFSEDRSYFDLREGVFVKNTPFHMDYLGKEESTKLNQFMHHEMVDCHQIEIDKKTRLELLSNLVKYFKIHLGDFGEIKSLEIFREIFKA